MREEIYAYAMVTAVMAMLTLIVIAFLNFLLKRRIIDAGQINEYYIKLLNKQPDALGTLKWGILFLFGGLGLIVTGFLPYPESSPIPWGVEAVALAAGFLVYYLIVRKQQQ
ncbi:hypothetical protein [Chitinophaga nivalis]|uniref:DUF3784 domain-containing protein n=1 Tax=Chitinophaga nivalis TaxID=2991709 RepID=A0ABT3IJS2_9BACT|nr:hypothetical protein [Chitinophaga nivalis]MCW3466093.1 hypothetical protein [Chitinophaga nivalis]MCW3484216.1 hypothetical protein [Chitinophaga nivalis]